MYQTGSETANYNAIDTSPPIKESPLQACVRKNGKESKHMPNIERKFNISLNNQFQNIELATSTKLPNSYNLSIIKRGFFVGLDFESRGRSIDYTTYQMTSKASFPLFIEL